MTKGTTVKVIKGVKVPLGTTGTVIWFGSTKYGDRVGLKDADGTVHFTAAKNVVSLDALASPAVAGAIAATAAEARFAALEARIAALEAALAAPPAPLFADDLATAA